MVRYLSWTVCLEDDCKTSIKTVYRKPTKKDQYLHFAYGNTPRRWTTSSPYLAHSTIPEEKWEILVGYLEQKLSLIRTLMHQATTLVTNDKDNKGMINHVKSALCANDYTEL